jgi:hypothetical protein
MPGFETEAGGAIPSPTVTQRNHPVYQVPLGQAALGCDPGCGGHLPLPDHRAAADELHPMAGADGPQGHARGGAPPAGGASAAVELAPAAARRRSRSPGTRARSGGGCHRRRALHRGIVVGGPAWADRALPRSLGARLVSVCRIVCPTPAPRLSSRSIKAHGCCKTVRPCGAHGASCAYTRPIKTVQPRLESGTPSREGIAGDRWRFPRWQRSRRDVTERTAFSAGVTVSGHRRTMGKQG